MLLAPKSMHIYTISRVFRKHAPAWESVLKQLQKDRALMRSVYAPLRIAVNIEMRSPGRGQAVLDRSLRQLANMRNYESIAKTSRTAFLAFKDLILPQIADIEEDYVNSGATNRKFDYRGFTLEGGFHARVLLKGGGTRFLYVHPSAWPDDQRVAFIELLAIMGEGAYGCQRSDVWFVDLPGLCIRRPGKAFVALRNELVATMRHFERVRGDPSNGV